MGEKGETKEERAIKPVITLLSKIGYSAQVAIVKEMTGRNRAAQLEIVKQMSRQ